jgi:hypothetical protein
VAAQDTVVHDAGEQVVNDYRRRSGSWPRRVSRAAGRLVRAQGILVKSTTAWKFFGEK